MLTSTDGRRVFMDVDYGKKREKMQGLVFSPAKMASGKNVYEFKSDRPDPIILTLWIANQKQQSMGIDTKFRPATDDGEDVFYIKSSDGSRIRVTFQWKEKAIKNVNVTLGKNPFIE